MSALAVYSRHHAWLHSETHQSELSCFWNTLFHHPQAAQEEKTEHTCISLFMLVQAIHMYMYMHMIYKECKVYIIINLFAYLVKIHVAVGEASAAVTSFGFLSVLLWSGSEDRRRFLYL